MTIVLPGDAGTLDVDAAANLLRAYWVRNTAVWALFDEPVVGERDVFLPMDVLSLNALNARLTMGNMTEFWSSKTRPDVEVLLTRVTKVPLSAVAEDQIESIAGTLASVAEAIDALDGWGDTRVGKLLYRVRPRLAPIFDAYVASYYSPTEVATSYFPHIAGLISCQFRGL